MTARTRLLALVGLLLAAAAGWRLSTLAPPAPWTDAEKDAIRSLWLGSLPPLPADPSNAVADDARAAALGERLFFDSRLSADGDIACASCHQPERRFTDGLRKGRGIGVSGRNTLSLVGSAYSPWQYWDGRRDSQWAQALAPLEDPAEHGFDRMRAARLLADDPHYRRDYEALFGPLPDFSDGARFPPAATPEGGAGLHEAWMGMAKEDRKLVNQAFANLGKAIAAFERLLLPEPARFDRYAAAVLGEDDAAPDRIFSAAEVKGLRLFIGEARCLECHNGPLFTNHEFHNTGILSFPGDLPDRGRSEGLRNVLRDPFNCLGPYSDAGPDDCLELRFVRENGIDLVGAFRTPSLRNLDGTAPYMHKGQLATLDDVLEHYNEAPQAMIGHNDAKPLNLTPRQLRHLKAFLQTLGSDHDNTLK